MANFKVSMDPPQIMSPLYEEQVKIINKVKTDPIENYYEHVEAQPFELLYDTLQYKNGTLKKLKSRESGRDYVAKVFEIGTKPNAYQRASREITLHVLAAERCVDNVVGPRRIFYNQNEQSGKTYLYFVLDYWVRGTLYDLLKSHFCQGKRFRTSKIKLFVKQIANALRVMHSDMGVAHRDVKPENILVGEGRQLYLGDFGFAKQVYHSSDPTEHQVPQLITPVYTKDYASPEIVKNVEQGGTPYDMKCDVWSLGIITYVFHTGRFPFYSSANTPKQALDAELRYKIKQGEADWGASVWQEDPIARQLVQGMLQVEPEKRYSIEDVLEHPWFHEVEPLQPLSTPTALFPEGPFLRLAPSGAGGDNEQSTHRLAPVSGEQLAPKSHIYQHAHGDLSTMVFIDGRPPSGYHRKTDSGVTAMTEATEVQQVWLGEQEEGNDRKVNVNLQMEAHMRRQRSLNTMPDSGILNIAENALLKRRRTMSQKKRQQGAMQNFRTIQEHNVK